MTELPTITVSAPLKDGARPNGVMVESTPATADNDSAQMITSPLLNDATDATCFFNRDLSWMSFNERVLAMSADSDIPLGERLRFITISANNLDEFFMVRIAGMLQLVERGYQHIPDEDSPLRLMLDQIMSRVLVLKQQQQQNMEHILTALQADHLSLISPDTLSADDRAWLFTYFEQQIMPLITPITIDPSHPFPFIQNKGKGILLSIKRKRRRKGKDDNDLLSIIMLPPNLDRFICLPTSDLSSGGAKRLILVEHVILLFIEKIYAQYSVIEHGLFRVLRDSEIEIDEEAEDLINQFEVALKARRRGNVVSLMLSCDTSVKMRKLFIRGLGVDEQNVYTTKSQVGLGDFAQLFHFLPRDCFYRTFSSRFPQRILDFDGDCFAAIRNKDIIVQHPYESFDVVVKYLEQAAEDPDVLVIRQTLYRTTPDSPIVRALVSAAEAGKSVTAVIELRARFDEENNIRLARVLERAGVYISYGLVDLKIHLKLSVIIRREGGSLVTYSHCGTGNYHPVNAKLYTDFSYFTCSPEIGRDLIKIFNYLTSQVRPARLERVFIAPHDSFSEIKRMIRAEILAAKRGDESGIWIKNNAIVDHKLIELLYTASNAGVPITLIVRGICCLRPQVPGFSENIVVKSIVGRFLEHGRLYIFANGGKLGTVRNHVFMSSSDLMPRNLYHRVEAFIPLLNVTVRKQVLGQVMSAFLSDNVNCWTLCSDGSYVRASSSDEQRFSSHEYFMTNPSLSGLGSLSPDQAHSD